MIEFFYESVDFKLQDSLKFSEWLNKLISLEGGQLNHLNFIFCNDEYLLSINQEYLHHDTYTDIITFPLENYPIIEGDIFISVDRVKDNALKYEVSFDKELLRVMAHGILHLCGFKDKSEEEIKIMRDKEEVSILLFSEI